MIQWPLRFVDPQNHTQNKGFWTLVGRQLQRSCKQSNGSSGNSGTVCTRRHDPLQVEQRRSPRVREPSSLDPVEDAELCGLREPCSQLRRAPTRVQRNSANSGWLNLRRVLMRRISAGFIETASKATRDTRIFAFFPARYFLASTNPEIISLNSLLFIAPPSSVHECWQ